MNLQMEAQVQGPTGEADPFLEPQAIAEATCGFLEIRVVFNRIGTSRALFECVLTQQGYGSPVLYTEPVSP